MLQDRGATDPTMAFALPQKPRHKTAMAKAKVEFKVNRIEEGVWQIIAEYPGHEDRFIKGLTSREECYDWLNGSRKIEWLRSQGYAKRA